MKTGIIVAAACAAMLWATQAAAQSLTSADREALASQVAVLDRAMSAKDFGSAMDVVPPRLIQAMSERFGATPTQIRQAVAEAGATVMANVESSSFRIDLDAAEGRTTPDGARAYFLIPTETVVKVFGSPAVRIANRTLAFEDDGWWMVRTSDAQQVMILREVYPEFVGVAFPAASTTVIE